MVEKRDYQRQLKVTCSFTSTGQRGTSVISGLMGGATYSVSVVAVSFTLHSDETTAVNIIIGISNCIQNS